MVKKKYEDDEDIDEIPIKKKSEKIEKPKLKQETKSSVWGIVFFVSALFIFLSLFKSAGILGKFFYGLFHSLFGVGYFILPILLAFAGYSFMKKGRPELARLKAIFGTICLLSILAIIHITVNSISNAIDTEYSGYFGQIIAWPFTKLFGVYAGILLFGALVIISLLVIFDERPNLSTFWGRLKILMLTKISLRNIFNKKMEENYDDEFNSLADNKQLETESSIDSVPPLSI